MKERVSRQPSPLRTAEVLAPDARRRELLERLADAVGRIQDSDSFRRYLDLQSRFSTYSWGNVCLIAAQRPDATRVAGYRAWQRLGRQVRRGEAAIRIIVPLPQRSAHPETDASGDDQEHTALRFGVGHVFDLSQTEGEPLPEVAVPVLEGDDGGALYDDLARFAARDAVRVDRVADLPGATMGFYDPARRRIVVREAAQIQMTKTLAHELAHHLTGRHETYDAHRDEHETVAEAAAYVTLAHFGLDSGARSFPYIATWAKDRATLTGVLGTIQGVTNRMISAVEGLHGLPAPAAPTDP